MLHAMLEADINVRAVLVRHPQPWLDVDLQRAISFLSKLRTTLDIWNTDEFIY